VPGKDLEPLREVTGAVGEVLAEKSGVLEPVKAIARALTTGIDAMFYPPLVTLCQWAASKIEEKGLRRAAIETLPFGLLRGILEGGAMEQDENMRERWANLLANAVTEGGVGVRRAFPGILGELEPRDALLLDELAEMLRTRDPPILDVRQAAIAQRTSLDNLVRLELMRYAGDTPTFANGKRDPDAKSSEVTLTAFGLAFLQACREPQDEDASDTG
jgi:hypothetical protein